MEKGLTEDKISRLENFRHDPVFNERERIAIEFAEKMATNHTSIDDDFFRRMRAQFTDAEIVEIGMAAGQYIGFGRLLMVLDLERPVCDL
jgi:alkylhydroperoxidase family enzyme